MNIDIQKFADLFEIKVRILDWNISHLGKRLNGSDAQIINMNRKTEKNEPFRAQLQKIKQLITYYKSVRQSWRKGFY